MTILKRLYLLTRPTPQQPDATDQAQTIPAGHSKREHGQAASDHDDHKDDNTVKAVWVHKDRTSALATTEEATRLQALGWRIGQETTIERAQRSFDATGSRVRGACVVELGEVVREIDVMIAGWEREQVGAFVQACVVGQLRVLRARVELLSLELPAGCEVSGRVVR